GDPLSLDKMNNADDIKWYLVDNEAADPSGTPAATGTAFTIPADAGGKKIKIVYRIKTATGTPDSAFLPATVLLTSASSGVSGDSAADGTISNKLRS
ncbi:two-partner-like secretion system exoprotein ZirU, partial [Salmonella enterica]